MVALWFFYHSCFIGSAGTYLVEKTRDQLYFFSLRCLLTLFGILLTMNDSNATEIEKGIGSEVAQFVYRVAKKNHDAMMQLNKQFVDAMRKYRAAHLIFQLNNTEAPMEGITNISKTVSANQGEKFGWS